MISRFFIDRPIFASVLSMVILLAGGVTLSSLPLAQYPDITPPTVQVLCSYPGANAQTVADTVAAPIEQQVNGVEDMLYMSSQCTNDGAYTLTVTFKLGTDLKLALVQVQNACNWPCRRCPTRCSSKASTSRRRRRISCWRSISTRPTAATTAVSLELPDDLHSRREFYVCRA